MAHGDAQHILEVCGAENGSRWFFREDGPRSSAGGMPATSQAQTTDWLSRPRSETVYQCAVAFTQENFVIAVDGLLSPPFAAPLGIPSATELRIGRESRAFTLAAIRPH